MDPLSRYDYLLPEELIARHPPARRDGGRLLDLRGGELRDGRVGDLAGVVGAGDLVVVNDTRVLSARIHARRATGGQVEVLLLGAGEGEVEAFLRPARRLREGEVLEVEGHGSIEVIRPTGDGTFMVRARPSALLLMEGAGAIPLPPYLRREAEAADSERYQTVYAREPGAVAAPTAGLHLTEELLATWRARGARVEGLTLHVGPGTFRPLRPEDVERGELHEERYTIPEALTRAVDEVRAGEGRVLAVGTTSCRALEAAATEEGGLRPGPATTRLFIQPGHRFRVVDLLLTNFHLPRSSLLALVHAFAGPELVRQGYEHAVAEGYRFYSYGDAMLLQRAPVPPVSQPTESS